MDESKVVEGVALIAHDQAAAIPPEGTTSLGLGAHSSAAMRRDHFHAKARQRQIERISVIGAIPDQAAREVRDKARIKGWGDQGDFVLCRRGGADGERKSSAVCHCHALRTFAPLGFSNATAPSFATMNAPSMKHSERSSPPRSLSSWPSASRTRSSVRSRTQRWKRRWQVWYGGYRSGKSAYCAPVLRIHRMPFITSRLLRQGRPRPSARRGNSPIKGPTTAHCSSVRCIAMSSCGTQRITGL